MDSSKIKLILIAGIVIFAALYLGVAAATAQLEAIAWIVGGLAVAGILSLGKHIWILIPVSLPLSGGINALPGSPRVTFAAAAVVGGVYLLRFALRSKDFTFKWTWLDFAVLIQGAVVAQAYIRNPSGVALFGGDSVGGKPYFIYIFAILAYFLLTFVRTNIRVLKIVVILMVLTGLADGLLGLSSEFFPGLAALILPLYSGVSYVAAVGGQGADAASDRVGGGKNMGESAGHAAFTLFKPASTLNPLRPLRFLLISIAIGTIVISGFRSSMGYLFILFIVGSCVRRRFIDVVVAGFFGLLALAGAILAGIDNLPFGAQRILSVLPVGVDDRIKASAEASSTWRFEMWELALSSDRYIRNKILGDGFSFRADELAAAQDAMAGDRRSTMGMNTQDIMLARGSYHGFHVEAIRMTGIVGLVAALVALIIFFRVALDHIRYFRDRPELGYILFICMPFLIHPFYLMLVFGSYRFGFPEIIIMAGMLKLLTNIRTAEAAEKILLGREDLQRASPLITPGNTQSIPDRMSYSPGK